MLAVILAGGRGTRLRPYTITVPKPLVPVGERAILEILLRQLRAAGVDEVRLAVNHMADLIMAFCGDGSKFGLSIRYALEAEPLGTVGPLARMEGLPECFLVLNGDVLTDLDFAAFFRAHVERRAQLTLATFRRAERVDFGVLELDPRRRQLTGFREKPVHEFDVSMGVYGFHRDVLQRIPAGRPYGLDELVLDMLAAGQTVAVYPYEGYWLDLGRADDYERANRECDRFVAADRP